MKYLFKLFRLPNLIIVAILQCLIYFNLLMPLLRAYDIDPSFPPLEFGLFVLVTLLITGGGYIINDLVDYDADVVNKEGKVIVRDKISVGIISWIYYGTIISGFFLALFLAFFSHNLNLLWIFPVAVFGLFIYSIVLKRKALIGNVVVAFFAGAVAGIVAIAGKKSLIALREIAPEKVQLFLIVVWAYVGFAFLSTFFREIVKDIEDIEGDKIAGFKTFPIIAGINVSKRVAMFMGLILLMMTGFGLVKISPWLEANITEHWIFIIIVGFLAIVLEVGAILALWRAKTKKDYWKVSQIIKLIMVMGIVFLSFIQL